jgi:hypothetical protein
MSTRVVYFKRNQYDVYIGRPGPWGNPFKIGIDGNRDEVLAKFEEWFSSQPELIEKARQELKGKTLGCWCTEGRCHGDIIVKYIDAPWEF